MWRNKVNSFLSEVLLVAGLVLHKGLNIERASSKAITSRLCSFSLISL